MKRDRTISATDLRANTGRVLRTVERGNSLTITRRRKPSARLVPLDREERPVKTDDPFFQLAGLAEPMGLLTNEQIDRLVYGG